MMVRIGVMSVRVRVGGGEERKDRFGDVGEWMSVWDMVLVFF